MDKNINRIIKNYINSVLEQEPGLISAFLFGSYAQNKQRLESDIDIALVFDNLSDSERFNTQVKLMMLASEIDTRIEPHPISKQDLLSNNPFVLEIKRTGIELKVLKSLKVLSTLQTTDSEIHILSEPKDTDYTVK
jgi:predicted nucleotidyltransferase